MPFYERGDVRIHYEQAGSGFPLLVIPGGGLNSTIAGLASQTHPFNRHCHGNWLAARERRTKVVA